MSSGTVGVVAAVVVGGVLVVSGVAKLAAPGRWRTQAGDLGVGWAAGPLPYVEIVLAALLVAQYHRHVVAWCAVALLGSFTTLLVVRLAQGRRPPCACFGSLSAKPIGPLDLVRNALLIGLAVLAAVL